MMVNLVSPFYVFYFSHGSISAKIWTNSYKRRICLLHKSPSRVDDLKWSQRYTEKHTDKIWQGSQGLHLKMAQCWAHSFLLNAFGAALCFQQSERDWIILELSMMPVLIPLKVSFCLTLEETDSILLINWLSCYLYWYYLILQQLTFIWSYICIYTWLIDWNEVTLFDIHWLLMSRFCLQFAIYKKSSSAHPHLLISVKDSVLGTSIGFMFEWPRFTIRWGKTGGREQSFAALVETEWVSRHHISLWAVYQDNHIKS